MITFCLCDLLHKITGFCWAQGRLKIIRWVDLDGSNLRKTNKTPFGKEKVYVTGTAPYVASRRG